LLGLAYNYVNESVVAAILEELGMPNPLATYFDKQIAEYEQRLAEARAEARAEEKRAAVRAVLQARLGALPADIERRIATADVEDLNALLPRAALADRFDEL